MTDATAPTPDETASEATLDEVPAAAGGNDDTEPEQGEGEKNSY